MKRRFHSLKLLRCSKGQVISTPQYERLTLRSTVGSDRTSFQRGAT